MVKLLECISGNDSNCTHGERLIPHWSVFNTELLYTAALYQYTVSERASVDSDTIHCFSKKWLVNLFLN